MEIRCRVVVYSYLYSVSVLLAPMNFSGLFTLFTISTEHLTDAWSSGVVYPVEFVQSDCAAVPLFIDVSLLYPFLLGPHCLLGIPLVRIEVLYCIFIFLMFSIHLVQ